jgi:hypothetical protein
MTTLTLQALNRATLSRQWLLERQPASALEAIEHLAGMQSQAALSPYTGLWTRLANFQPDELVKLMHDRTAVRLPLMRGTIHLVSALDAQGLYPLLREVRVGGLTSNQNVRPLLSILDPLTLAGQRLLSASPLSSTELGEALALEFPEFTPADLSRAVRDLVPGVQVPPRGIWGQGGQPITTTLATWLGSDGTPYTIDTLVRRYLAAFGPATPLDMQQWSGLTHLTEVFTRLRPTLRTYRLEGSTRDLYDLESIPLPDPDTPAPIRFLPDFDNLYLSHTDRTRVLPDEHRPKIFTNNGIIKPTVLINGLPCALWKPGNKGTLTITPLQKLPRKTHTEIEAEAHNLLNFLAPTTTHTIKFQDIH